MRTPWLRLALVSLSLSLLVSACGPQGADDATAEARAPLSAVRLRLVAANLTSGNLQSWDPGEGARILQGVHPDVAMLQEFNEGANTAADFRAFVDATFGATFSYVRGPPAQIPNGIVSRYPILASGDWVDPKVSNRDFVWARIDIPGPKDLWAVSVHLLTSSAANRQAEGAALAAQLRAVVPPGDMVVIGGDYNTSSRTEAVLTALSGVVDVAGPYPADQAGDGDTNAGRTKPYDWVLVSPNLTAVKTPVVLGSSTFPSGAVIDTRVYSPLADLAPARSTDSAATNMQHMAVVRDFLVDPGAAPVPSVTVLSPNGGEALVQGTSATVTWQASNVSAVDVAYAADGATFATVASGVAAAAGGAAFTLPAGRTSLARVRVAASDGSASDVSDGPFTVLAPSVRVLAPNGGETLAPGTATTITWQAVDVAAVDVAYAADGVAFTAVASGVPSAGGSVAWTVPAGATTAARVRVAASGGGPVDVSDGPFTVAAATPGKVFLNEILANEPGSAVAGEFVELVNSGGTAVSLAGWTLSDATQVRHTFPAGTSLAPGAAVVVFGAASGIPGGLAGAVAASTGSLNLANGGDSVVLKDAAGVTADSFTYPASLAGTDGVSMNRSPDWSATGSFVLHTALSTALASPGVRAR